MNTGCEKYLAGKEPRVGKAAQKLLLEIEHLPDPAKRSDHPDKARLKRESQAVRERLIRDIDSILKRQDHTEILASMESFKIEAAARRSVSELLKGFKDEFSQAVH